MSERWSALLKAIREEGVGLHPRLHAAGVLQALLPERDGGSARARLLALAGFELGVGTSVEGWPRITGTSLSGRLRIGKNCRLGPDCVLDLIDTIQLDDDVTVGPGVMILTSTHELASPQHRAGNVITAPVRIGRGAWLGPRSIILPGANVGEGAVVEAGSVVNKEIPAHTRVGGIPAMVREKLGQHEG